MYCTTCTVKFQIIIIILVKREPTNRKDRNAVGLFLEDVVVGHVPHNSLNFYEGMLTRPSRR